MSRMKRFVFTTAGATFTILGTTILALSVSADGERAASRQSGAGREPVGAGAQDALVRQYCVTCHSEGGKAGGLSLALFDAAHAEDHAAVAEKMIRKLRAGMMPPPGARRPSDPALLALAEALETRIDKAAA